MLVLYSSENLVLPLHRVIDYRALNFSFTHLTRIAHNFWAIIHHFFRLLLKGNLSISDKLIFGSSLFRVFDFAFNLVWFRWALSLSFTLFLNWQISLSSYVFLNLFTARCNRWDPAGWQTHFNAKRCGDDLPFTIHVISYCITDCARAKFALLVKIYSNDVHVFRHFPNSPEAFDVWWR